MPEEEARERMSAGGVARQQGMEKIPHPENGKGPARDLAAALLGTNRQYVSDARYLLQEAPRHSLLVENFPQARRRPSRPLILCINYVAG